MENLSHSLSKNAYNGSGFGAKTVYADAFGGPPKFGISTLCPGVGDYREIFGSFHTSRASSIPILDLPAFDDSDVSFDVRSSGFDYSEVFGGFNGLEFFVSHDEVLSQSKSGYDSSEEAWTPAQSETLSNESDHSACSETNQSLLNGDSHQSFVGTEPFNISRIKANQRSNEDISNGTSQVAQPDAVPRFSFLVNETSQNMEDESPSVQVTDDLDISMDFCKRLKKGKQFRKTMSQPPSKSPGVQTFGSDFQPLKGCGKSGSPPSDTFITVSDISLRTQPSQLPPPSRPPPALAVKEANYGRQNPKLKASRSYAFERSAGNCSPPFFDVEIDASSSATAYTAVMKDAMEKAQTKLTSAKEVMERKKEGLQIHMKLGLENDVKDKGKKSKTFDEFNSSKDEKLQEKFDRECFEMKTLPGEEKQKVAKTTMVGEEKHGKEFTLSRASLKTGISASWREATQFYEVVETEKSKTLFVQAKDENVMVQKIPSHEPGQKKQVALEAFKLQKDGNRKNKATRKAHERVVNINNFEVVEQTCECDENGGILKATKDSCTQEHHEKKEVAQKVCDWEENVEKLTPTQQQDIGMISTETDKCEKYGNLIEVQHNENEVQAMQKLIEANGSTEIEKRQVRSACERKENGRRLKESLERGNYEKKHNEVIEKAKNEKGLKEALGQEEKQKQKEVQEKDKNVKRQNEAFEQEEKCSRLQKALEQEKNEKGVKAFEPQDTEKRFKKLALELEESEENQKLACDRNENERRLREALKQKENEKKLNKGLEQEKNVKEQEEIHKNEEVESKLIKSHEREEKKQLKEALKREGKKKCLQEANEREERDKASKEVFRQEEIGKRLEEASEWEETECSVKGAVQAEKLKERSKNHEPGERDKNGGKLKLNQETCEQLKGENFKATDGSCGLDCNESLQAAQVPSKHDKHSENCKLTEEIILCTEDRKVTAEPKDSEGKLEPEEAEDDMIKEGSDICGMGQNDLQHEKCQPRVEDAGRKSSESGIGTVQTEIEGKKAASQTASDPESLNLLTHEWGEIRAIFDQEDSKEKLMSAQVVSNQVENGRKLGISQPTVAEKKINAQKVSICQNSERKEKMLDKILTTEERAKDERMKRERELEMDRLRKIEEEREREREREKDHMDIEKATREVHERALTEAREKAERAAVERATAEARQRALAEARERLEKACAEVRERSFIEKTSMEARLRTERAAAERANAEARERVERSVADKFYVSSRDSGRRYNTSSSDFQFQNVGLSSELRYSRPSVHAGVEGDSAQRCKAILERHQRTAERAAKALAEKNMRDILAQREQAERNRLAEILDAEVKRWSNGKEGNLRALLSTLQYILGPDSGWQPVPLTEVITTAAVKKAYRKATLCVHPDKLQQRRASIQQKYICEKVFDLLKEAWNRFNSEER